MTIKAPFNFVPLSDKVFFPEWAKQISHDIPFEDGESGIIELKITAETPIFVRNGHCKQDTEDQNDRYKSFSNEDGKYFIPATSVKGAIRNVLEIISFGKMHVDKSAVFAQRDWDNRTLYPLKQQQKNIHCGWLVRADKIKREQNGSFKLGNWIIQSDRIVPDKEGYYIIDCGEPNRIGHNRIDEYLGGDTFRKKFSQASKADLTKEVTLHGKIFDPKTAIYKYELTRECRLENIGFEVDTDFSNNYGRNCVKVAETGNIKGSIVFTGQPDTWKWKRPKKFTPDAGKFYDFVFKEPESEGKLFPVSIDKFNHFKFIYSESKDWTYAKERLETERGIPVFFRIESDKISDFGLAYLYKLPYDNSPLDLLSQGSYAIHSQDSPDLAECMFGHINDEKKLKGRIQFSNAFSKNAIQAEMGVSLSLSSPKASYYPMYIKQKGRNGKTERYLTYNDGTLSGWKRYPVKKSACPCSSDNVNIDTVIFPVKEDAVFQGEIRFHNLKEVELGALLSALTFHNSSGCYHQIGQGKPYGYGKVSINCNLCGALENREKEFMAKFEEEISSNLGFDWHDRLELRELFSMAHNEITPSDVLFDYMHMDVNRDQNEFLIAKKQYEFLELYTALKEEKPYVPLSLKEELMRMREKERMALKQKEEDEERLKTELINNEFIKILTNAEQICTEEQMFKENIDSGILICNNILNEIEKYWKEYSVSPALFPQRIKVEELINKRVLELQQKKANTVSLPDRLSSINNIKTILGGTKTWMKMNNIGVLSEKDAEFLKGKLANIYNAMKHREQKEWCDIKKLNELIPLIGEVATEEWIKNTII